MANEVAIIETRATRLAEKIEVFYNIYAKSEPVVWKSDVSIENSATTQRILGTTGISKRRRKRYEQ